MRKLIWIIAVVATSGLIAGCGGDDHNGHSGSADGSVDRAFAQMMIPHHESAIEMAKIAQQRGESPFVKKLAGDIIRSQSSEIATLRAADKRLEAKGLKVGDLGMSQHMMGMDGDTDMLNTADPFDPAFMKMMIPHHEGAVEMAKIEMTKGSDPELMELADKIVAAQESEITQMRDQLGASDDSMSSDDSMG